MPSVELRTEEQIISTWDRSHSVPMVSIRCQTFNHADYIDDAIRGFLIQETSFPFEIVIHDDASTDGTSAIIKEYSDRYPRIIKPICQKENQWSRGLRPMHFMDPVCKGKYVAMCEGDDYWTDPNKLTTQVEFLEENPDYVISGHDAFIIDESGNRISDSKLPKAHKRDFSSQELIEGKAWILTMSWVYRNIDLGEIPERNMVINGDYFFTSLIGHYGKSKYHTDVAPAAYRQHEGGIWSALETSEELEAMLNTFFWMYRYYKRIDERRYADIYWAAYLKRLSRRASPITLQKIVFLSIREKIGRLITALKNYFIN